MKTITVYYRAQDNNGIAQIGATVNVYPAGTADGSGISVSHTGSGIYKIIMDPDVNVNALAKYYDVWLNGVKQEVDQFFGDWGWKVAAVTVKKEKAFLFTDLLDENGEALPTTIDDAEIHLTPKAGRFGWVKTQNSSGFTIDVATAGDDDYCIFDIFVKVTK